MSEQITVSGLAIDVDPSGDVSFQGRPLGRVGREERFEQWFWRAYDPETGEAYKRFFTARHEAIRLLLLNADLMDGLGF